MKYLLDTNIVIAALNGEEKVKTALNALSAEDEVLLSVIVWAELRFGALCSARTQENLARVDVLCRTLPIVEISQSIASRVAQYKAILRKSGITKSDFDLLIAASAVEASAVLVTDDRALLDNSLQNLTILNWR